MQNFSFEMVKSLLNNQENAISIKGYFDFLPIKDKIELAIEQCNKSSRTHGIYLSQQIPFYNASRNPELLAEVLNENLQSENFITNLFYPFVSPLDYFLLNLNRIWPYGVSRLSVSGKRYPCALFRIWPTGYSGKPHQDVLRRETDALGITVKISCQIGFNLYLSENSGGELHIWDKKPSDSEINKMGVSGSYGVDATNYGPPTKTITPSSGDLIMLNTENLHAVSEVRSGIRATLSGFIGFTEYNKPLLVWS